jgi:hypothetical protein
MCKTDSVFADAAADKEDVVLGKESLEANWTKPTANVA